MSIKSLVKKALIAVQNGKYQKALAARRMSYARWQEMQADVQEGTSLPLEDYVVLQGCPGTPAKDWRQVMSAYLLQHPECLLVYGDEDVERESGMYDSPYFKPDWSPDLLEQWFYVGGLVAVHRSLIEDIEPALSRESFVKMSDRRAFQELIREAAVRGGGYEKSMGRSIGHVPKVLFHRQVPWPEFTDMQPRNGQKDLAAGHLLSIVIPSKDHPDLLDTCLGALMKWEKELSYQVIIVDNGSSAENRQKCQEMIARYQPLGIDIQYLYEPMEFNFSRMCNLGARRAQGDLLLFLNDDVEPACENAFKAMAERALQPYTGAVGLKLYYPGGKRIQHCGITNLPMGPVHKLQFLEDDRDYYMGSNLLDRNVLAVTAACLMVTKEKFLDAGGFPEELQVAFNDVSLCFRLYEQGYHNLIYNQQYAYHHESLSRGDDEADHKLRRLLQERQRLYQRHPRLEGWDPYYPKGLGRDGLDTRIRPAYETGGNRPQSAAISLSGVETADYRQDPCLMLRVEMSTGQQLLGYGVVLGDDNSCYEKKLLLVQTDDGASGTDWQQRVHKGEMQPYIIPLEGQYRPDLVENMPDQKNVGLCGFWLQVNENVTQRVGDAAGGSAVAATIPPGTYGIGMLARNWVTGTKLIQFTNRQWSIECRGKESR